MTYRIRQATAADAEVVIEHITRLLAELSGQPVQLDEGKTQHAFAQCIAGNNAIFMAFDGEKPIGVITIVEALAIYTQGVYGVINELYVEPVYRSSGIGKLLVGAVWNYGANQPWSRIEVGAPTPDYWQRTVDFYEREGFIQVGPKLKKMY